MAPLVVVPPLLKEAGFAPSRDVVVVELKRRVFANAGNLKVVLKFGSDMSPLGPRHDPIPQ
jgi:hypothetical protein